MDNAWLLHCSFLMVNDKAKFVWIYTDGGLESKWWLYSDVNFKVFMADIGLIGDLASSSFIPCMADLGTQTADLEWSVGSMNSPSGMYADMDPLPGVAAFERA
ncbi:hypothetical protein Dimus_027451 [Dionaea muscipula]